MMMTKDVVEKLMALKAMFKGKFIKCNGRTAKVRDIVFNLDTEGVIVALEFPGKGKLEDALEFPALLSGHLRTLENAAREMERMMVRKI